LSSFFSFLLLHTLLDKFHFAYPVCFIFLFSFFFNYSPVATRALPLWRGAHVAVGYASYQVMCASRDCWITFV
jgi:hypothetical protein